MTTTILTDEQISDWMKTVGSYNISGYTLNGSQQFSEFARAIEQAVLQSEQVQEWKRDAERYQFAAQHCVLGGGVYKFGWPVAPVGKRQFDKYLDAAMEKQP